jgi:PEP-CTERM motif
MLHRFCSAMFLLLGVIFFERPAFAEMTLFDFNQLQPTSKHQASSYMTIQSYMEDLYGSQITVSQGTTAAIGSLAASEMIFLGGLAPSVSSSDTFLLNGKGKNSGLTLSFGNSPINSFAVGWEVFKKGSGITIKADGVVIFQELLTKSQRKTGVSEYLAPIFFDHPIHTLEFIGVRKSKIGIDNLAVNITLPGDDSEDSSPALPFTDSGHGRETEGNKAGGFQGWGDDYLGQNGNHNQNPEGWKGNNDSGGPYRAESEAQVPEPATFVLFGVGLLLMAMFPRRW